MPAAEALEQHRLRLIQERQKLATLPANSRCARTSIRRRTTWEAEMSLRAVGGRQVRRASTPGGGAGAAAARTRAHRPAATGATRVLDEKPCMRIRSSSVLSERWWCLQELEDLLGSLSL